MTSLKVIFGIDQAVKAQASSATFEVWVDGKKRNLRVMYLEQILNVNLSGCQ